MTSGIRWLSVGPGSGYGQASQAYLTGLRAAGVPVSWSPIGWPSSTWDSPFGPVTDFTLHKLDRAVHLDIANRAIEHDVVVVHSTPLWHDELGVEAVGRQLVAYTTWETDRLPADAVAVLNRYDLVLVPSRFNASAFNSSGVTAPVRVVPHIARAFRSPVPAARGDDGFIFYLIATWTSRKAILDAVSAYRTAFTNADDVRLVIHTTAEDLVARARFAHRDPLPGGHETATWFTLANALAQHTRVPKITLSTRRLAQAELDSLHAKGDCFVSLSRGEGWGLGAFDAAAAGNPVIVTGWGGTGEFLPAGYPYCVDYDLVPTVTDEPDEWWHPQAGERWAKARIEHAASILRHVFEHRDAAHSWGGALRVNIESHFTRAQVTRRLLEAIGQAGSPAGGAEGSDDRREDRTERG